MSTSATPYEQIAGAIIDGQVDIMGNVAYSIAGKVPGLEVDANHKISIVDADEPKVIDALVKAFSGLTGPLGVRMCFNSARSPLALNPQIRIAAFENLQS